MARTDGTLFKVMFGVTCPDTAALQNESEPLHPKKSDCRRRRQHSRGGYLSHEAFEEPPIILMPKGFVGIQEFGKDDCCANQEEQILLAHN